MAEACDPEVNGERPLGPEEKSGNWTVRAIRVEKAWEGAAWQGRQLGWVGNLQRVIQ